MKIEACGFSVIGGRQINQDSFLVNVGRGLFAVADGVGGGLRGEVASQMAVAGLENLHPAQGVRLEDTVKRLQELVLAEAYQSVGEPLMGTTLTAVLVSGHNAELCHVGDSRLYVLGQGVLRQITQDHETYDEKAQCPVLSSYLGLPREYYPLRIQEEMVVLHDGEILLLCSDGLYKQLADTRIRQVLEKTDMPLEQRCKMLVEEAATAPQSDNVTVVLVSVTSA